VETPPGPAASAPDHRDEERIRTSRLDLLPLDPAAARVLPQERDEASRIVGAAFSHAWPLPDLVDILPKQAALAPDQAQFGIWLIVERESGNVVGDTGFHGPPADDKTIEIGYSVIPDRRRRGYATEAVRALVDWARGQPGVDAVVAGCEENNQASIRTLEALGFRRTGQKGMQLRWRS
jgi:ribosomal-protein-alanine N-acetyltransferase